jgi:hypothetical protein
VVPGTVTVSSVVCVASTVTVSPSDVGVRVTVAVLPTVTVYSDVRVAWTKTVSPSSELAAALVLVELLVPGVIVVSEVLPLTVVVVTVVVVISVLVLSSEAPHVYHVGQ